MTPSKQIIDNLVQKIIKTVDPLSIWLFGSAANGTIENDSDIDLLIVMPEGTHRRKTAQYIYRNVSGIPVPFDIIVATPSDLEKHKDNIGLIYQAILKEGREVYVS
jgi:predicted nucleotidyltransferase